MTLIRRKNGSFPALFEDFFGRDVFDFNHSFPRGFSQPAVNITEKNDAYLLEVAAPGLDKKDIQVEVENDLLTISYEKQEEKEEKNEEMRYTQREFDYQSFKRSFSLPKRIKSDKVEANYKDGVLQVTVPKNVEETSTSRLISIK